MRAPWLIAIAAAAGLVLAAAGSARGVLVSDPDLADLLSGIDFIPTESDLDDYLGDQPGPELLAIADDESPDADPGLRIRAYRALAQYPGDTVEDGLADALARYEEIPDGVSTLYLRAAMESLALTAGATARLDLEPLLDHASRDVRAAAARALATTGSQTAVPALRARLEKETVLQVRLALQEAIRDLTENAL